MEDSPPLEVNGPSARQKMARLVLKPKVAKSVHKNPPPVRVQCELNPLHTTSPSFPRNNFIILPFTPVFEVSCFFRVFRFFFSLFSSCLFYILDTVVGANLCVRRPLDVKDKGIRGIGRASNNEAYWLYYKHYFP